MDAALVEPIAGQGLWRTGLNNQGGARTTVTDTSVWISPSVDGAGNIAGLFFGDHNYEFTVDFTLTPGQVGNVFIYGYVWADGKIPTTCGIMINGTCVDTTAAAPPPGSYVGVGPLGLGYYFETTTAGFQSGLNRLRIWADNLAFATGVRVDLEGVDLSVQVIPEPAPLILLGTGLLALAIRKRKR